MAEPSDELMPGARTAIVQCLNVGPEDRVFILTEEASQPIADALASAARERGAAQVTVRTLEEFGARPLVAVPDGLMEAMRAAHPTVSIYAAGGQPGEIRFRIPFGAFMRSELRVRHGHMIGITPELMRTGMTADYRRVAELTTLVNERVVSAREIHVEGPGGTNFTVTLDPEERRWVPCTGIYHQQGDWGNLPEGETFTAPAGAEGTIAASLLGDYFSAKYGLLDQPLLFHLANGAVVRIEHADEEMAREVWDYLNSSENGRRVGEFAIGTNETLTELTGNLLQDEKYPGVHVAFGNPYPDRTGANWSSEVHVDVIPLDVSIRVDGEWIMRDGTFLI
ncbi:MAG TPA: aminopeptidase [Ardenticatenaceae bacterium]|nr:aminopeptidase [Ardenticatenaceae bacterium]